MASKIKDRSKIFLRICNANMESSRSFKWKKKGIVQCSDYIDSNYCGNGLHAFDISQRDVDFNVSKVDSYSFNSPVFMAIEVLGKELNRLSKGKVKFKKCRIIRTYKNFEDACLDISKMRKQEFNGFYNPSIFKEVDVKIDDHETYIMPGHWNARRKIVAKNHPKLIYTPSGYTKIYAENCSFFLMGYIDIKSLKNCKLTGNNFYIRNCSGSPIFIERYGKETKIPANNRIYQYKYGTIRLYGSNDE